MSCFPMASEDQHVDGGWTLSVEFLKAVQGAAMTHGADVSLEDVEAVLLVAEVHAILWVESLREALALAQNAASVAH